MNSAGTPSSAASWRASLSGSQKSSESRNAIHRPDATEMPILRAAAAPWLLGLRISRTRLRPRRCTTSALPSIEPSSTTIISKSSMVCASTLSSARRMESARLNDGTTTETRGAAGVRFSCITLGSGFPRSCRQRHAGAKRKSSIFDSSEILGLEAPSSPIMPRKSKGNAPVHSSKIVGARSTRPAGQPRRRIFDLCRTLATRGPATRMNLSRRF